MTANNVLSSGRLTDTASLPHPRCRAPELQGALLEEAVLGRAHRRPSPLELTVLPSLLYIAVDLSQRLSVGTPIFGRIHSIHPLHLVVSLPNQMFAHVPMTQISGALTARLNALSTSDDGEQSEDEEEDVPSLDSFFRVGQYVRANVTALHLVGTSMPAALEGWKPKDEMERGCRRVEITLDPKTVNEGVKKVDLEEGFVSTRLVW